MLDPTVFRELAALFEPHVTDVRGAVLHVERNLRRRPDYNNRANLPARAFTVIELTQLCRLAHCAADKLRNWHHAVHCAGCEADHRCSAAAICPLSGKCLGGIRRHISTCVSQHCVVPHCYATRLILRHFRNCVAECTLCAPFRADSVFASLTSRQLRAHLAAFQPSDAGCVLCAQTDLVLPNSMFCLGCSAHIPAGALYCPEKTLCALCEPDGPLLENPALDQTATCGRCGRFAHHLCALLTRPNPNFVCPQCLLADPSRTPLARRVRPTLLLSDGAQTGSDAVARLQLLARTPITTRVDPRVRLLLDMPAELPGAQTCYGLFTCIDGVDVLVFLFYTLEYGADCPEPNRMRAYINYVDSVHYFQPKEQRTAVYHRALRAYIQDAGNRGFRTCHIWSCPPVKGDEYIFVGHPPAQKRPNKLKLLEWYRELARGIPVSLFADAYKDCTPPFFEGDLWAIEIGRAKSVAAARAALERAKKYCLVLTLAAPNPAPPLAAHLDSVFATRDRFIQFCRANHLQFATLLHAKQATAAL